MLTVSCIYLTCSVLKFGSMRCVFCETQAACLIGAGPELACPVSNWSSAKPVVEEADCFPGSFCPHQDPHSSVKAVIHTAEIRHGHRIPGPPPCLPMF